MNLNDYKKKLRPGRFYKQFGIVKPLERKTGMGAKHQAEHELSEKEQALIKEGLQVYENVELITLHESISNGNDKLQSTAYQ